MNEITTEKLHCGHCDRYTLQEVFDSGHERDGSHDWQKCLECGWWYNGMIGVWSQSE